MKNTEIRSIDEMVDFLVPFTNTMVNKLSSTEITKWNFKREVKKLKIGNFTDNNGIIESYSTVFGLKIYVLYEGTRNFIFKLEDISGYIGFTIMITNKGMIVHDDAADDANPLSKDLKKAFLENYKSPYLVTKTFLNFMASD